MRLITILFFIMTLELFSQSPKFSFSKTAIEVVSNDSQNVIKVYKGAFKNSQEINNRKSIIGNINRQGNRFTFSPLLPFQVETNYTIIFNNTFYEFSIPLDSNYKILSVENLYPNSSELPSNLLKWYVEFSKPVNPTNIYDHISLIDNRTQKKVDRALLPLETPLLSNDGKLLTLWVEPGRQKRDLGPNKRLGKVLEIGESYTLIIDGNLKDSKGISMQSDFRFTFKVSEADRTQPNINNWKFDLPYPKTKDALIIHLNDNLDYGSLTNNLIIYDDENNHVEGVFTVDSNNKKVMFSPFNQWKSKSYVLKCNKLIEDVAGNNLERLFDRDVQKESLSPTLELSFSIN
ncbi:hypothetical protein [Tenacibaculum sp. 190524A05c]|uniref:hypothetical protein n=1 Tax=Tenacibaculum platacis TaxID=3137852 RepID=UPI0031FA7E05